MSKDELSEERIEAVRQWAERDRGMPSIHADLVMGKRFRTVLALIESRKQALARVAELEAQLARVHDLQDRWWNHGDELDALYAERLSTALTPPETAAGKEGKP